MGEVYGLGSWASGDDGFIQALVNGKNIGDNPLKLKVAIDEVVFSGTEDRRVFNLSEKSMTTGTNRVIRIYRRSSSEEYHLALARGETQPPSSAR